MIQLYEVMRIVMNALPFVVWQLAFLFLLFFVVYKNRISWGILSLLVGFAAMLAVGYYERKQQWLVIPHKGITLRLGPGASYPLQGNLTAADKVRVLKVRDGWSQIEHNGVIGWIDNAQC